MNINFMFQYLVAILCSIFLGCAPHALKTKAEEPSSKAIPAPQEPPKQATDTWLETCQSQLSYLKNERGAVAELDWSTKKKEDIIKLALITQLEIDQESASSGINEDNGKLPVNIVIGLNDDLSRVFLLSDGEVETIVKWENEGNIEQKTIKSWTGSREGVEKHLEKGGKETVCLRSFYLLSWGEVHDNDIVVLTDDYNKSSGCIKYIDGQWRLQGWSSYGGAPIYSIIMWEENGKWRSIIRFKRARVLTLEEICQVLYEEQGSVQATNGARKAFEVGRIPFSPLIKSTEQSGGIYETSGIEWIYSEPAGLEFTKTEVTLGQFKQCVANGACDERHRATKLDNQFCNWGYSDRYDHPMNCVDWYGAKEFCEWIGGRLPTEDEWYKEASDGGNRTWPWGDSPDVSCDYAIMYNKGTGGCGKGHTWPVCSKTKGNSVSGLCDMSGNVWEWTSSSEGSVRILRGGALLTNRPDKYLRTSSSRIDDYPVYWSYQSGFRCVR